jgi:hypothetical protein
VFPVCAHTGDSRNHFQLLPAFPWDSLYISKSDGKFDFQHEIFLFVCFLEFCPEIFSAKLSNSVKFLLRSYLKMMELIGPQVHWEMYLFPAVL